MADYLRKYVAGGTVFLTVVTQDRRPFLTGPAARRCLHNALVQVSRHRPWETVAVVVCPDHFHTVWALPEGDADYSLRMAQVKEAFTRSYLACGGREGTASASRAAHRERGVWQARFWDHVCRDEADLKRCADYVHWNPVKHGLVSRVIDYPWSSFHRYLAMEEYPADWGGENPCPGFSLVEESEP